MENILFCIKFPSKKINIQIFQVKLPLNDLKNQLGVKLDHMTS